MALTKTGAVVAAGSGKKAGEFYTPQQISDTLTNDWDILREPNPAKKTNFDTIAEDVRFKNHSLAPKSAADFAFLLHGFHFRKEEGVLAIILPPGVVFRSGAGDVSRASRSALISGSPTFATIAKDPGGVIPHARQSTGGVLFVCMKIKYWIPLPVAALAALLCAPALGTAQSILLSSGDFTLLGGSAITNTGVTVISNGNVGLSPTGEAAITGFALGSGTIAGGAIIPTGSITEQARADLLKVQAGLAGMPFDINLTNQDLGGMTLLPGVYSFASTAGLTGDLTLDGNGQNGAFWVFQIGSSLTTAANANVNLTNTGSNLGSDYGIFWNVGTVMTTGADNTLLGNYLAGSTITLGTNSSGSGRLLALTEITIAAGDINATGGPLGGDWTGGLMYAQDGITVIPEPSTYAIIFGLAILWVVFVRRLRGSREA